ncbi:MAG TPA: cation transporter, partial [Candidatus Acetothermia bacterium]|nr:cation transporter [Candidatus Acetothermia bacterium]
MMLNFVITAAEIIGGLLSGSLALLSDAIHNFSDGVAIVISYTAIRLRERPNSPRHTFGFKRAEVFAAVINSSALIVITVFLFIEAIKRFINPVPIHGQMMFIVAA